MRQALVSLIAAAAVAAPALAQEATPAVPAQPTETPATPAQPTLPEAAAATPAPAAVEAAPAVVAAPPVAEAPPPPPPPPTEPTTVRALALVETLCKPMVTGGDPASLTKSLGFKKKRETFVLALAKPTVFSITPSPSNKNVCLLEIDHPVGADKDMTVGLHNWAIARGFTLYRNDEFPDQFENNIKRHTRSWEVTHPDGKTEALVLITSRKLDGSSLGRNADKSTVMYSVR